MSSKRAEQSSEPKSRDVEPRETGGKANWFLLEGSRLAVAGGILGVVLLAFLALVWSFDFTAVRASSPMYFLFSSLVTGDLTLVTVVLSINQLVLSRELGAPGTLSQRIEGSLQYRNDVAESAETGATPKSPTRFLRFLHEQVETDARGLDDAVEDVPDAQFRERLGDLVTSVYEDVATVDSTLDASDGAFSVVAATITTNHATQLREIAALREECADALTDELCGLLDALETHLLQIDVARKYFKTVFVQKELAYLSRVLLYVGVPAIAIDALALVFYNALGPTAISAPVVYAVAAVAFVFGFAPLAVLFAFVLRLAWVAQRTATVAPFSSEREYP